MSRDYLTDGEQIARAAWAVQEQLVEANRLKRIELIMKADLVVAGAEDSHWDLAWHERTLAAIKGNGS